MKITQAQDKDIATTTFDATDFSENIVNPEDKDATTAKDAAISPEDLESFTVTKPEGVTDEEWDAMMKASELIMDKDYEGAKTMMNSEILDGLKELGVEVSEGVDGY